MFARPLRSLHCFALASVLSTPCFADLNDWLTEVGIGTTAVFSDTNIAVPVQPVDIGVVTGQVAATYEFVVNATNDGPSSALMGSRNTGLGNNGAFKWEQWMDSGQLGVTNPGVIDLTIAPNTPDVDTHVVFVTDYAQGTSTLYVNGSLAGTTTYAPWLTGDVGIGIWYDANGNSVDSLTGNMIGCAVYDSAMTAQEIQDHSDAYFNGTGSELCNGDGGDQMGCTNCPCGNNALIGSVGGCLNSAGTSGRINRSGSGSISAGDLRLEMEGGVPMSLAVLVSGTALAPRNAANPCYGSDRGVQAIVLDGLRCAVQSKMRHELRPIAMDGSVGMGLTPGWGPPDGPTGGLAAQNGFLPGATRYFQIFYLEVPGAVCQTAQNSSQALSVTFTP